jgi:DNA repair exonuclease SbcCD ATPase subunit
MRIQTVEWKNFNSYGNQIQKIEFEKDSGDLYLLLGSNGHGKSTISEVITFALYGRIERKNKSDLPNRINKNLWCRIVIRSKNKIVEITRGVSPNLFEVKIDTVTYDTAGNANVQDYLETEIFDIPYQVFKNIIVLSINDFRSFLTMSTGDKRNIVDRLFGFTIINQMRDQIRSERKDLRDRIKTLGDELNIIQESIESVNQKISTLESSKKEDRLRLIEEYKGKIKDMIEQKRKISDSLSLVKTKETEFNEAIRSKGTEKEQVSFELRNAVNSLKLYNNAKCPTCNADLNTEDHQHLKSHLEEIVRTKQEEYTDIQEEYTDLSSKMSSLSSKIKDMDSSCIKINLLIGQYKNEAERIAKETKEEDMDYLNEILSENEGKLLERKSSLSSNSTEDTFLDIVEGVLGDDGVKNLAMKTILPTINQSIQNMSKQMHLPYMIKFDEKFDCSIQSLGEEINARSMSTGERKKADFVIIISLLRLLKIRYPSLNLLFLDEIFSSVDSGGIYEILKILKDVSVENSLNTWVVNHTELPIELFDKRVEAVKESGFSKLHIENIS